MEEKQKHKFLSFKKKYGRYNMHMTQHIFIETGRKRYGPINWIIFVDNEHIVLNTYIKDHKVKIDENYLDTHWNNFVMHYNYNVDVWSMAKDCTIEEFNDYRDYLLPDTASITITDIDKMMDEVDVAKKEKAHMERKVRKIEAKLAELLEKIKVIK